VLTVRLVVHTGRSWSKPTAVEPTVAVAWPARVGSGTGIQLRPTNPHKPGRILNVGWHLMQPPSSTWVKTIRNSFDVIFHSDDAAKSWQQPQQSRQLNASCNEAQLAELPNGDILAIMRPASPVNHKAVFPHCPDCRVLSLSSDGGDSWGWKGQLGAVHPEPQLAGAICLAALYGDRSATYAAFPGSATGRAAGVVRVSDDNAATWRDLVSLGDAKVPFAYSSLTEVPDSGSLGLLWETSMASRGGGCVGDSCRTVISVFPKAASGSQQGNSSSLAPVLLSVVKGNDGQPASGSTSGSLAIKNDSQVTF
jgi:hypothetical protein